MDLLTGMERRTCKRTPTTLGMRVYAYGMLIANGMTVDLSEQGLLLRIQQDYSDDELDPGKHLDVMLEYSEQWLPIQVVRKWEDGIAARFIGEKPQVV